MTELRSVPRGKSIRSQVRATCMSRVHRVLVRRAAPLLLLSLAVWGSTLAATGALIAGAAVHPPLQGEVPPKSAVLFSTRFTRPQALPLIHAFQATRVEWVYLTDRSFAASLKSTVPWLGGAISGFGALPDEAGYARDFDGHVLAAPWAKSFDGRWASTNHPATQAAFSERLRQALAWGADSIQHDDAHLQAFTALYQGGDFNDATVRGFGPWLDKQTDRAAVAAAGLADLEFDYRQWLRAKHGIRDANDYGKRWRSLPSSALWLAYVRSTVIDHFKRLQHEATQIRGRRVPFSMNFSGLEEPLATDQYFFLVPHADYTMPEVKLDAWPRMVSQAMTARSLRIGYAPSILPVERGDNRVGIASLYALGGTPIVPWDVYLGPDSTGQVQRFFGTPEDYADGYRFVRANASMFDGLETAALVGIVLPVDKGRQAEIRALVDRLVVRRIPFAFVPVGNNGDQRYRADAARLRHLALLVTTNPPGDYPPEDRAAWVASGTRQLALTDLRNPELDALSPFVAAPGAENLRIVPRANAADSSRLVLHVIDTARGEAFQADADCRRRIGIRRAALGGHAVADIELRSPTSGVALQNMRDEGDYYFFTVTGCPLWAVVALRLAP